MIRYTLKCLNDHVFDSWFQSAAAFDTLGRAGHLRCEVCGTPEVEKTLMAPQVAAGKEPQAAQPEVDKLAELRREVEQNATYVGGKFAEKAREIHEGISPETSIYGEASGDEARKLIEDGVPVVPLPFKPKQKLQ